jgi:hypothetical protein
MEHKIFYEELWFWVKHSTDIVAVNGKVSLLYGGGNAIK